MSNVRVMVVDDSVTMRALFSGVLERAEGIQVVGCATCADDAREQMKKLKPDVITLDVEMPGMTGLEFLEEIMQTKPTPVIMLSTLTQKGGGASLRAHELGAYGCFPKPKTASPEEFDRIGPQLAAMVRAAASGEGRAKAETTEGYNWNGKVVAMAASTGGIDALLHVLPAFPGACPPVVVLQQLEPNLVEPFRARLSKVVRPQVKLAANGMKLLPGCIYLACDPTTHFAIDQWPNPILRTSSADPIGGCRPSANVLFATLGKTAKTEAVGVMLTGQGSDGVAGLKALRAAGARTIAEDANAACPEAPLAAKAADAVDSVLPLDEIAAAVLAECRATAQAA